MVFIQFEVQFPFDIYRHELSLARTFRAVVLLIKALQLCDPGYFIISSQNILWQNGVFTSRMLFIG